MVITLATLGSIASLCGLVQYNFDNINKNDNDKMYLSLLSMLAHFGASWKQIHSDYHSLIASINPIVELLTEYRDGMRVPHTTGSVAPNSLRKVIHSGNLNAACLTFKNQTKKSMRIISGMKSPNDENWKKNIAELNNSGFRRLSENLVEIAEDRGIVVEIHQEFMVFLNEISKFSANIDWDSNHVDFFIDNRALLSTKYHEVIRRTDNVIMQMLDCFDLVTRELQYK